jgi:16S rRNA (cytidine1402-2'-O)-methyltransferase
VNIQRSYEERRGQGTLYVVGTPIGNLEDMTFRAIRVLKEADWIAAEDTRQTRKLLAHFGISGRLVSYREQNRRKVGPELVDRLSEGQSVALVSDAGMPAISDPGYDLVRLALERGIAVVPIPGANAAIAALVVSGLPTDRFLFVGFLPREPKTLRVELEKLKRERATIVCYEAPHRLVRTLEAMRDVWGDRPAALARELSKINEEVLRGTLGECLDRLRTHQPRGEYCIVVQGAEAGESQEEEAPWWADLSVAEHVAHYERQCGDRKEAMRRAAADRNVSRRDIYNALLPK